MDGTGPFEVLPQPALPMGLFAAYQVQQHSFSQDELSQAKRARRTWRAAFLASTAAVVALAVANAVLVTRHTEHWGMMVTNDATGEVRVIKDIRDANATLPLATDNYFLRRYVEMRLGWNEASADQEFRAVVCMSEPDEGSHYAEWNNKSPNAPQQKFTQAGRGWREARAVSDPVVEGRGRIKAELRRVAVPFAWDDRNVGQNIGTVTGTARFTVRRDPARARSCNPAGLFVSDFTAPRNSEPTP